MSGSASALLLPRKRRIEASRVAVPLVGSLWKLVAAFLAWSMFQAS